MKRTIFFVILLITGISCQQTKQTVVNSEEYQSEAKQQIDKIDKLYFEAWANEDLDSLMSFIDEGFINMFSLDMADTKEQSPERFQDVFDNYSIEDVEFKSVELIADLNYAFETGFFKQKWITNDKQDTILFNMRGVTIFKKQDDGSWKVFRNIGQQ